MGGDLLYRWGNPQAYGGGTAEDQQLFQQHDTQWITSDLPGEDNILVFNNGNRRLQPYSTVLEITTPLNPDGSYDYSAGNDPGSVLWEYVADQRTDFFADHISGAQRLANGNTLICDGPSWLFL